MPFPLLFDENMRSDALWTAVQAEGNVLDVLRIGDAGGDDFLQCDFERLSQTIWLPFEL